MSHPIYPSDLTDVEWERIQPLLPSAKPVGKHREVDLRDILDAIFYRADNGIKWRALPSDFPAWQTVYGYFRQWVKLEVWEQLNAALVEQVRINAGRQPQPSLGIIDSQSVRLGQKGGDEQGFDGHKKVKGRKRHIVVDVMGLVLGCYVMCGQCCRCQSCTCCAGMGSTNVPNREAPSRPGVSWEVRGTARAGLWLSFRD